MFMSVRTFVDTNILLYAHDVDAAEKHTVARQSLTQLWSDRTGGFWDALICASAHKANVERILSEDLNSGQRIAGIRIENPFIAGLQPTTPPVH
jgi:predicted nucleic acid-binding protein